MASTGAYIIVAAGCSAFGFAVGVAGDLLRQRLLAKNKVLTHQVPDVDGNLQASFLEQPATGEETRSRSSILLRFAVVKAGLEDSMMPDVEGNLQASFLEQPATEEETRSRSSTLLRFAVVKAGLEDSMMPDVEGNQKASFLEQPATEEEIRLGSSTSLRFAVVKAGLEDSMTSTMESVTHVIVDALPYSAGEGVQSPCDALQAEALQCVAIEDESFAPDLSQCLPGCLDPVRGLHHAKCLNHESRLASKRTLKGQVESSQEPLATDCIGQSGAVPYCETFECMAVPYGPPTLKSAEEAWMDNV